MNRCLVIPFSISLSVFVSYLFIEASGHSGNGSISTPVTATRMASPKNLLSIDDARNALLQDWQPQVSNLQLFSRSRPYPPVHAFAILDEHDAENEQLFFTGVLNVVHNRQQSGVPVVIDRVSRSIFIFAVDRWHSHEHWLENHAPKRPAM